MSGAPTWPNASVDKAVAMKMGNTRAGVCLDPTGLIVDGGTYHGTGDGMILPTRL
jgi:hypothetical protein